MDWLAHNISTWDVLLAVLVLFIAFGHRLPGVMRMLGGGPRRFL